MKPGWEEVRLADICTFKPPKSEARRKLAETDMVSFAPMEDLGIGQKYLRPSGVKPLSEVVGSYTYFADGDVLLAKITPCFENGKLGIARDLENGLGFGSSEYFVIRPSTKVTAEFLYYFLSQPSFLEAGARSMTGAVGHKRVSKDFIEGHPFPLPPLPEQHRIVAILDEAFAGIVAACSHAEQNLLNARALFESQLQAVFSQRGEGWVETTVRSLVSNGSLAKPQDGNHGEIHPTKADYVEAGVPFIMAADLAYGAVDTHGCRFISEQQARSLRIGFAVHGDVLLSHKGTIGRVAILQTGLEFVMLTPQVTYYRVIDQSVLLNRYLYFYFQAPRFMNQMGHIANAGSTRAYIGITRQMDLEILVPPIDVQFNLVAQLEELQAESRHLESLYERKIGALHELRQSLLHQAFSGNL